LTDVRVPVDNVIGEENDGWGVAMTTLGFERGTGLGTHVRFSEDLQELVTLAKAAGVADDPIVRDQIAQVYAETEVYRHNMYRTLTRLATGKPIGPEASLNKLYWSEMEVRIFDAGMELMAQLAELGPNADKVAETLAGGDRDLAALAQAVLVLTRRMHLRGDDGDPEEHHLRAGARPAEGAPVSERRHGVLTRS
jgi:hypothetical protein